jgi:hypothetical protein
VRVSFAIECVYIYVNLPTLFCSYDLAAYGRFFGMRKFEIVVKRIEEGQEQENVHVHFRNDDHAKAHEAGSQEHGESSKDPRPTR